MGLSLTKSELGIPLNGDVDRRDLSCEGELMSSLSKCTFGCEGDFLNRERIEEGIEWIVC